MAAYSRLLVLLGVTLCVQPVLSTGTSATTTACTKIRSILPGKVFFPGDAAYTTENDAYYNIGLSELGPSCITLPTCAEDVSTIVKTLNYYSTVPFPIKSGGHDPNSGFSSVANGVLIALSHLNGTEYDPYREVAYVKPGGHWIQPITALAPYNVTVLSGRLGTHNSRVL